MKKFWALYFKEMKRIRSIVIFLVLLYGLFLLLHLSGIEQDPAKNYITLLYFLIINGTIWMSPFLFAYLGPPGFKAVNRSL